MSYWQLANDIESISFRLNSIKSIIEMVAEGVTDGHHSGALWACGEMLEVYEEKLEALSEKAMDMHRDGLKTKLENVTKKGKKK